MKQRERTCDRMMRALLLIGSCMAVAENNHEAVVGNVRVQTLSPVLVRVEPKGKWGYEDRNTMMVQNRRMAGEPITEHKGSTIRTKFYTVQLNGPGSFQIFNTKGDKVYDSAVEQPANKLHWPAPSEWKKAYALTDSPRFHVPDWTVSPLWPGADCGSACETNGYDFGNAVEGDTYIFLLGDGGLEGWTAARKEFASLTGPVPLLPDFAYGTWFTWWHFYTYESATHEVDLWDKYGFPLDVWGLDMNWRIATGGQDKNYNSPNGSAFADFPGWFKFLHGKDLRTYFNDHPQAIGMQTTKNEVNFRWSGLTGWLAKGLDFWWYDHNWKFSIPPPQTMSTDKNSNWGGLSNIAWGSHIYYSITAHFNKYTKKKGYGGRPICLSSAMPSNDVRPGMDPYMADESPGHHRYPVWWTGDKVPLLASIESMVDAGVYHFKPFVHSDCGGDGWFTQGDFMRWTEHCTFGSILRYHGGPHQPWIYGDFWGRQVKNYLNLRYMMLPSLIAAGQRATFDGSPLVARGDLFWPDKAPASASNHQYIFIQDFLVAPIWESANNMSSAKVWIPPGDWQDAWNGEIKTGPATITSWQPWERMPLFHRMDGGLVMLTSKSALRTKYLDFSNITLEAFPCKGKCTTKRKLYERGTSDYTDIVMKTDGSGVVRLEIGKAPYARTWVVRFNLRPGFTAFNATIDGKHAKVTNIPPRPWDDGSPLFSFFPFKGPGKEPASKAGPVAEIVVPTGKDNHVVQMLLGGGLTERKYCTWHGQNCLETHCCKISGNTCFKKNDYFAICNETCVKGHKDENDGEPWSCEPSGTSPDVYKFVPVAEKESMGATLFCFTAVNTSSKHEAELVETQKNKKIGIFGCDTSAVYKVSMWKTDVRSFTQVWDGVSKTGEWEKHDWTVKVHPDTVFLPDRLRTHLATLGAPKKAALYVTYHNEWLGVEDAFHLYSKNAVQVYLANQEDCAKYIRYWSATFSTISCMDGSDVGYMSNLNLSSDKEHAKKCTDSQAVFFAAKGTPDAWLDCYNWADNTSEVEVLQEYLSDHQNYGSRAFHRNNFFTMSAATCLAITGMLVVGAVSIVMRRLPVQGFRRGREWSTIAAPVELSTSDFALAIPTERDDATEPTD